MHKQLFIIFSLILTQSLFCSCQENPHNSLDRLNCFKYFDQNSELERDNLLGKVSSVKTYRTSSSEGRENSKVEKEYLYTSKKYSESGDKLSFEVLDRNGNAIHSEQNSFSDNGNLIKTIISSKKSGTIINDIYEISETGKVAKYKEYKNGKFVGDFSLIYDKNDKISEIWIKGVDYAQKRTYSYKYDNMDRVTEKIKVDSTIDGIARFSLDEKMNLTYNSDGFLVELRDGHPNSTTSKRTLYELDENNCLTKVTKFNPKGEIDRVIYYQKNGTYAKKEDHKTFHSLEVIWSTVYKYEYDDTGNWITRKNYRRSNPKDKYKLALTERREIMYF